MLTERGTSLPNFLQPVRQSAPQLFHPLLCFIAHVGNAEIETLHLSISTIKYGSVGFLEPRNPLGHIHPTRVFAAGQAERLITLFWKYLEPIRRQPRPPPLRILAMAFMPLGDPSLAISANFTSNA